MGELLRSIFGSPERAKQAYDIGSMPPVSMQSGPTQQYELPQLETQVASIEKWLAIAYNEGILINDDWVIKQVSERGILVYEDMLDHDPHVFACFETLAGGAAKTPFQIKPASDDGIAKEQAEFIRAAFDQFDLVSALTDIAHGEAVGYSVCELVLDKFKFRGKDQLTIRSHHGQPGVVRLDPSHIVFDYLSRAKLTTLHNPINGAFLVPYQKYVVYKRGSGPYGDALLKHAFQPYWFKRSGNMFLAKYIELFGVPPIIAYHKNAAEMQTNLDMLAQLRSASYGSFPNSPNTGQGGLLVMQPGRDSQTINTSLDFYNDEISKAIVGGTRTMARAADGGAYSATEIHGDQVDDRQDNIVRRLTFILNQQIIQTLIRVNFGVQRAYPRADFGMDDQETPNDYMERVGIWAERGVPAPISKSEFYQKSGFSKPTDDNDELYAIATAHGSGKGISIPSTQPQA